MFVALNSGMGLLGVNAVDERVWRFFVDHRSSAATGFFKFMSMIGNPVSVIVIVTAITIALLVCSERRLGVLLVLTTSGTWLTTTIVKLTVARARPPIADRLIAVGEYSFPSGHASQSVALYGSLAVIALIVGLGRYRTWIIAAAIFMALAIGISRLYLGVHWLSDVAGGWLLGTVWVIAVWSTGPRRGLVAAAATSESSR